MFKKVLIANRGEIALRVIRACRELGIQTVAVYSEADRESLHVRFADDDVCIGPPPSRHSYLRIPSIIAAAEITGADAIHPGYGFLAENAEFAETCRASNITFIGPTGEQIRQMGDKATARRLAAEAGVPTVPGSPGTIEDPDEALAFAESIGFPVIIKAAAGGGGKGMRVAQDADQFAQSFGLAQNEALAAFGNGAVYIEKYLQQPAARRDPGDGRQHGKVVHLGERDCSVQRRHQKLIEESPSPALDAELRERMGDAAVALASNIGYMGAGTIEFLLDTDGSFYFMEMNTRIQVEHPVTEMVTGFDLVKEQIRVAAGEPHQLPGRRAAAARARDRVPDQRRGSLPWVPALPRRDHRLPPAGRARRAGGHPRVRRLHRAAVLRLAARQGDRPRQRSHGGPEPDGTGAGQLHPGGHHHHHSLPRPSDPASRLRRREGGYPVPRAGIAPPPPGRMKLDVLFTPAGLTLAEVQGRTVFVIDILRATTSMCAALSNGARAILPVASTEEALRLAQTLGSDDVRLAGEKNCLRIEGFHLGNSPLEMTESAVRRRTMIVYTTNGTKALLACQGAAAVYPTCAGNLSLAAERARETLEQDGAVLVVCAGRNDAFSLDDGYTAGRLVAAVLGGSVKRRGMNDAALASLDLVRRYGERWERPLRRSRAGRELIRLGFAEDVADAARLDAYPVLPMFHDRRVTLATVPV